MEPFTKHIHPAAPVVAAVKVVGRLPDRVYGFSTPTAALAMNRMPVPGVVELSGFELKEQESQ